MAKHLGLWGRRVASVSGALGLALVTTGCFFYDSRWGQREEEQRRTAESLRPAKLERKPGQTSMVRVLRVRAYATHAYAAETLSWERQFEELLRGASAVLEPSVGLRLESGGTSMWQPSADGNRMDELIGELAATDKGEDVGWVVGFVESAPRLVTDFHQLGVGRLFGKHLVVRASNDPAELAAITQGLDELDEREKARLYAERKQHKAVAVFLHEIAHTLGAQHRTDAASIMSPVYDPKASRFDDTTLGLLRMSLASHLKEPNTAKAYQALLDYYRANPEGWADKERQELIRNLEATLATHPAATAPQPAPNAVTGLDGLGKDDRDRYERALRAESEGDARGAWRILLPIVESYPNVYEVQDLRCRLSQKRGAAGWILEAQCKPVAELRSRAAGASTGTVQASGAE